MTAFASCCVLSYERPGFLRTAVETLTENAGFSHLQLIVHDDGTQGREVRQDIANWLQEGMISTAILNPAGHNQGRGVAMNRCFAIAEGDPLIVIDQDLVFREGWLDRVYELLADNPQIGLLSGFRYWHDPCDWRKTIVAEHDGWHEHEYVMGSFMAIRRACWEELGPFEEYSAAFAEDHVFQRRVTASDRWVCGTPAEDLMHNQGYGVGPSTVVVAGPNGPTVRQIHTSPRVIG